MTTPPASFTPHDPFFKERWPGIIRLMDDWLRQETRLQWLYTILRYVTESGRHISEVELRQIVESVAATQRGNMIMATIAEKWLEQGIE